MNCLAFAQRLDAGDLDALAPEALAHAAGCATCARALAAARALESAFVRHLSAREVAAPVGLADAVMARVRLRQAQAHSALVNDPTPWWVGAAAQPSSVGAFIIAALLAWRGSWLLEATQRGVAAGANASALGSGWVAGLATWSQPIARAFVPSGGGDWTTALVIGLCLSPLALLAGYALYRAGEGLFRGPVRA